MWCQALPSGAGFWHVVLITCSRGEPLLVDGFFLGMALKLVHSGKPVSRNLMRHQLIRKLNP